MAKTVLTDVSVTINSVDLSDHISKVEVSMQKDEVDVTGFGASAKEILPGLADANIAVTFFQDFAAAEVDATLEPLYTGSSLFPIEVLPVSGSPSATNPSYSGTFVLLEYTPISGGVGEASTMDVTFRNASQAGITRGTA
jgi:hypothetical protein